MSDTPFWPFGPANFLSNNLCANFGGRFEAPFDPDMCTNAIQSVNEYKAAGNFWWQNLDDELEMADVPINGKRISSIIDHYFQTPAPPPEQVSIALSAGQSVLDSVGKLYVISPIEFAHAFIIAVHRDVLLNVEPVLQKWKQAMLSTSYTFKVIESEDAKHYAAKQIREDAGATYFGVKLSATAKIFELVKFKARKERVAGKLSSEAIAKLYQTNVRFSSFESANELPTATNFINMAISVHKRIYSIPRCRELLFAADEAPHGNALDSVCKLMMIAQKAKDNEQITWAIELLLDWVASEALSAEQLGLRALEGKLTGQAGRGIVDMCIYKMNFLQYLMSTYLDSCTWDSAIKATIRDLGSSIRRFRERCGYIYNKEMPDANIQWRVGFPKSAEMFVNFLENGLFGFSYDAAIRLGMVNRRDFASLCDTSPISDELEEIKALMEKDAEPPRTSCNDSEVGEGTAVVDVIGTLEALPELQQLQKAVEFKDEERTKLDGYMTQSRRMLATYVTLAIETEKDDDIVAMMRSCAAGQVKIGESDKGLIACIYDSKLAGESSAQPHIRVPDRGWFRHVSVESSILFFRVESLKVE